MVSRKSTPTLLSLGSGSCVSHSCTYPIGHGSGGGRDVSSNRGRGGTLPVPSEVFGTQSLFLTLLLPNLEPQCVVVSVTPLEPESQTLVKDDIVRPLV